MAVFGPLLPGGARSGHFDGVAVRDLFGGKVHGATRRLWFALA